MPQPTSKSKQNADDVLLFKHGWKEDETTLSLWRWRDPDFNGMYRYEDAVTEMKYRMKAKEKSARRRTQEGIPQAMQEAPGNAS